MNTKTASVFLTSLPDGLRPAAIFAHILQALAIGLRSTQAVAQTREMQEESALRQALRAAPVQVIEITPSAVLVEHRNEIAYLEAAVSVASKLTPYESLEDVLESLQGIGGEITEDSIEGNAVVKARYIIEVAIGTREPCAGFSDLTVQTARAFDGESRRRTTTANESISKVELEFSIEWARCNPDLFATRYNEFFREHADGWTVASCARAGFLTLIADRIA